MMADSVARRGFEIDELREHTWNPLQANPGKAIYQLLARDFAPLPDRLGSVAGRLAEIPAVLAEARGQLGRMLADHVGAVGADFGRVRTIKLEPQDYESARRQIHRDDNNRFNPETEGWVVRSWLELTDFPDSFMILMEQGPDGLPDPRTEVQLPLHRGARFVLDQAR